ncbi:unnamed protein product [Brachionus calyciflorus]|uniref:Uncharacterized protein n=1 Tax=Brachionus calyciflorus TaxID=104777 RepID=A0A813P492_9BILA|nr:unnamed protein product [Brachionus calyciflorus]
MQKFKVPFYILIIFLLSYDLQLTNSLTCNKCFNCKGGNVGILEDVVRTQCEEDEIFCTRDIDILPKVTPKENDKVFVKLGCARTCLKGVFCCRKDNCNTASQTLIQKKLAQAQKNFALLKI